MKLTSGRKTDPTRHAGLLLAGVIVLPFILSACSFGSDPDTTATGTAPEDPPATSAQANATVTQPLGTVPGVSDEPTRTPTSTPVPPEAIGPDGLFKEVQISAKGTRHLIPLDRIQHGGVAKDGIPSIDRPQFANREGWDDLGYDPDKLVIGVEVAGVRRAYPFQVLVWHELVNDTINGKPILISYCPLCGSAIAFERVLGEGESRREVEFRVSGLLYNSDLLMYDRETETLWSQILGVAVLGEMTGARLSFYPSEIMSWLDWQETYPDSEVLTRDTGHARDYDRDPYGEYYVSPGIMFPTNQTSDNFDALFPKEDVTGVELPGPVYGAYVDEDVIEHGPVNDMTSWTTPRCSSRPIRPQAAISSSLSAASTGAS